MFRIYTTLTIGICRTSLCLVNTIPAKKQEQARNYALHGVQSPWKGKEKGILAREALSRGWYESSIQGVPVIKSPFAQANIIRKKNKQENIDLLLED